MNKRLLFPTAVAVFTGLAACASSPDEIDSSLLAYVSDEERDRIDEARREYDRIDDNIASAERDLELAKNDLEVAKKELDVADATVEKANLANDVAQKRTDADADVARDAWDEAEAYRRWVESKIALEEARVDEAEAKLDHARASKDLAGAELELLKAEAVSDLDRPEVEQLDLVEFRRVVDRRELAAGDARIAAESAAKRVELRDSVTRERAEAVPAHFRPQ